MRYAPCPVAQFLCQLLTDASTGSSTNSARRRSMSSQSFADWIVNNFVDSYPNFKNIFALLTPTNGKSSTACGKSELPSKSDNDPPGTKLHVAEANDHRRASSTDSCEPSSQTISNAGNRRAASFAENRPSKPGATRSLHLWPTPKSTHNARPPPLCWPDRLA